VDAGYAGLTAARELLKVGKNVNILEFRERVGGRVYTQKFEDFYLNMLCGRDAYGCVDEFG
jgi:monoamine oxidase